MKQLIGDLLLRHNCVVVPAFGGFVAKQTSALIDQKNGVMLPPRKSLLFNKQLINNDGLLITAYAQASGKSYSEAAADIDVQVREWQKVLHAGERITLERVGYLFLNEEKNIGFEQDRFFNLLLESYGMGKVDFISEDRIHTAAQQTAVINPVFTQTAAPAFSTEKTTPIIEMIPIGEKVVDTAEPKLIPMPVKTGSSIKLWKYIAAASLLPIAFYSYWLPMKTQVLESGIIAVQDFNPFHKDKTSTYESKAWNFKYTRSEEQEQSLDQLIASVPENVSVLSYPFDEDLFIPVRIKDKPVASKTKAAPVAVVPAPEVAQATVKVSAAGNFHYIVGCFESESNANGLVKDLKSKGYDAYVVDVISGKYRVSAARSESKEAFKAVQLEGWVLRK